MKYYISPTQEARAKREYRQAWRTALIYLAVALLIIWLTRGV